MFKLDKYNKRFIFIVEFTCAFNPLRFVQYLIRNNTNTKLLGYKTLDLINLWFLKMASLIKKYSYKFTQIHESKSSEIKTII